MAENIKYEEKETVVSVENLELWFDNDYGRIKVLNGITFDIKSGETLGIVGESGCGKSMTSLCIMQLLNTPPAHIKGSIKLRGRELLGLSDKQMQQIRGNQISMIFQEPMTSLNPVFTIGNQLIETFMLHQGMNKKQAKEKAIEMLKLVKIPLPEQRFDEYSYQLSGGMKQRVMIAMALACEPDLLIADEPTTALDVTIQAQVLDLMRDLQKKMGTAITFITHDLGVVSEMCDRVLVLYCGEVMEEAATDEIFENPKHPYTEGLMSTLPKFDQPGRLPTIPGTVPPSGKYPSGCVFAPRCPHATDRCRAEKPGRYVAGDGHYVRCFLYEDGRENQDKEA
ncbi:MAG: ABC transporter ATP-binding protein [Lachnospiraceae bacterium]|nr:ABC transporter ATP-binding protein [Lachnospiraceae bacterium]